MNTAFTGGIIESSELDELGVVPAFIQNCLDHAVDVPLMTYSPGAEPHHLHIRLFALHAATKAASISFLADSDVSRARLTSRICFA